MMRLCVAALLLALGLLGCCPEARPPRKGASAGGGGNAELARLVELLAKRPVVIAGGGELAGGDDAVVSKRGAATRSGVSRERRPASDAETGAVAEGLRIPKPRLSREQIEKAVSSAVGAITTENADSELESLRQELGGALASSAVDEEAAASSTANPEQSLQAPESSVPSDAAETPTSGTSELAEDE